MLCSNYDNVAQRASGLESRPIARVASIFRVRSNCDMLTYAPINVMPARGGGWGGSSLNFIPLLQVVITPSVTSESTVR